jgi:O-antigen/teichoic acid export membrane protein
LIEILLIIPSALGNSLIHSAAGQTHEAQRRKFGALAMLMLWIGCFVTIMFSWFATPIIQFLGGAKYLGDAMHR